ncbi:unnamed protein product [marine sediment metagenome]|uniref:Uncharacterized protein n=1 Tax=marine sediment metagenome TaxID=412755 RepID=X0SUG7_9ZZZZ
MFKKYVLLWYHLTTLIIRIYILERYLSRYPDLKKFGGKKNIAIRNHVRWHRDKLKQLKNELKELVK